MFIPIFTKHLCDTAPHLTKKTSTFSHMPFSTTPTLDICDAPGRYMSACPVPVDHVRDSLTTCVKRGASVKVLKVLPAFYSKIIAC